MSKVQSLSRQQQRELEIARRNAVSLLYELEDSFTEAEALRRQAAGASGRLRLLTRVAKAANEAMNFTSAIQVGIDEVCRYTGWQVGHCYIQMRGRHEMMSLQLWHFDKEEHYAEFRADSEAVTFTSGEGMVGRVMQSGEALWQTGIDDDPGFLRFEAAYRCGLKSSLAFPVFSGDKVLAVLEFFSRDACEPDDELLELMKEVGLQLGYVVQRKQTEEKARLLEEIIRNANDGVILTDALAQGKHGPEILYVNEAICRMSGYTPDELIGQTPRMLQGEKTDCATLDRLRSCLETGEPFRGELVNYSKDGKEYWLDLSIVPIADPFGDVTHFAAIERDITERKAFEEQLLRARVQAEKSRLRAEEIAQFPLSSPYPLMKVDIEHDTILYINPATYNHYRDILMRGTRHPLLWDVREVGEQAYRERRSITREISVGNITYQQVVTPNLLEVERTINVYCYDVSRLKETEERLRQERANAEAASRAKSDFLANMSHELRTPMNGVLGMAGLLKDSALNDEQKELVTTIRNSGEALLMLLNDILDFSKIESGEMKLEIIPFNLHTILHETIRLLEPLAKDKGIRLEYICGQGTPDYVIGDPARIRQIVTNLVGNAIKFTEKGYVRLRVNSQHRDNGLHRMHFTVEDTGIGIPLQQQTKIFDKFTQADESTTRRFGGTGLGLAICKRLCEMMGGGIGVNSAPGKGSTFWFDLPLEEAGDIALQVHNQGFSTGAHRDFSRNRVLVVDDHPINLLFARKLLQKFGVGTIDTAGDGKDALSMLEKGRYDVLITDCQMPEMDGYEASRIIREREMETGGHIPIIAMTANAYLSDREKCLQSGMDDYVSKPINEHHLREVLSRWIGEEMLESACTATIIPLHQNVAQPKEEETSVSAPVDMEHLRQYLSGDAEEENEIIAMFGELTEQIVAELEGLLDDAQSVEWKKTAHKLKGSAANFGAGALSEACRVAETEHAQPREEKLRMLSNIKQRHEDIKRFFAEYLSRQG